MAASIEKNFMKIRNNKATNKTVFLAVLVALLFIMLILVGGITYLQLNAFELVSEEVPIEEFETTIKETVFYGEDGFVVTITDEVVATEVGRQVKEFFEASDSVYDLESIYYSGKTQTFLMNFTYSNFYLPIALTTEYSVDPDRIDLTPIGLFLGKNYFEPLPVLKNWLEHSEPLQALKSVTFNLADIELPSKVTFQEALIEEDQFYLLYNIDRLQVQEFFKYMKNNKDDVLVERFLESDNLSAKKAATLLQQIYPLSDKQIVELVNDARGNQGIIGYLLLLTNEKVTSEMSGLLNQYDIILDESRISNERKVLEGQKMDGIINATIEALNDHFEGETITYNQGKPYDMTKRQTLTFETFIKDKEIEVEKSVIKRLKFIENEQIGVAYKLDESNYYIKYADGYELVDEVKYSQLKGAGDYIQPDYVSQLSEWQAIIKPIEEFFEVDQVFVRYMKSDTRSAFAIVSPGYDPQQYWSMALYRSNEEEGYKIINSNVKSIDAFYKKEKDFNIEAITEEIENVKLYKIDKETHETILYELYQLGKITHPRNHKIIFSSYNGKYISFALENGDEFVYRVEGTSYGTYLTSVYTKDKAKRNWSDMPEMITLQDKPEE